MATTTTTGLSPRQDEILGLLCEGIRPRAIALHLGLAETTVRNHIRSILRKLGCHSQLEAVAVARRLQLH
jgi:DNA-binding CsgD family transcriptional regulator